MHPLTNGEFSQLTPYRELPYFLSDEQQTTEDTVLPSNYYNMNLVVNNGVVYPKRIVVIDVG